MDRTGEKLREFSYTIMKEADEKKKDIIVQAKKVCQEAINANEIQCLKQAYEHIQEAVHKFEKEKNEEVSKAIIESKHTLFNRRCEIIESIFQHVKEKLFEFRHSEDYKNYIGNIVHQGLSQAGQGDITILADNEDLPLLEEVRANSEISFRISESDDQLLGGCLVVNETKGFICDYSFSSHLKEERATFLENYGISID